MFTKIITTNGYYEPYRYNENKVANKEALLIYAGNFILETSELDPFGKRQRFVRLQQLNKTIIHNTLHISVNFHPSENMHPARLIEITVDYMGRLGFGSQPFLIYQHFDAGHPHVHVVATNIRSDGSYIGLYNIGRNQSETARKELEIKYGLLKGQRDKNRALIPTSAINPQKLQYGRASTLRSISNVLDFVFQHYRFCSLTELNAVLRLYNVQADPGKPGDNMFEHGGLVYQALDENGRYRGNRVKASAFYSKPGLNFLKERFDQNSAMIDGDLVRLRRRIDWALGNRPVNWTTLTDRLKKEGIHVLPYMDASGSLYELTFIDPRNKIVASGQRLGPAFSSRGILDLPAQKPIDHIAQVALTPNEDINRALEFLFRQEALQESMPFELRRQKKKKKERRQ